MTKQEQIERMKGKAGTGQEERPTLTVPDLKFNGSTGEFSIVTREEVDGEWMKQEEIIDEPVKIIPLSIRHKLFKYNRKGSEEILHWTTEYSSKDQKIQLWKKDVGGVEVIDEGTVDELRNRHDLSSTYNENVYCLYDGEIHMFRVKGSNLGNWWDTLVDIKNDDLFPFLVEVEITKHAETGGPVDYYQMDFEYEEHEVDLDEVEEKIDFLSDKFEEIDAYTQSQMKSSTEGSDEEEEKEFTGDGIDYPEDEDISPEDVPF